MNMIDNMYGRDRTDMTDLSVQPNTTLSVASNENTYRSYQVLEGVRRIHELLLERGSTGELLKNGTIDSEPCIKELITNANLNLTKSLTIIEEILEQLH